MCVLHRTDSSVAKLSRRHISMYVFVLLSTIKGEKYADEGATHLCTCTINYQLSGETFFVLRAASSKAHFGVNIGM